MDTLIQINRYTHIVCGFVGLTVFWVPLLTRKGGNLHRKFGKVFEIAGYIVALSAILSALLRTTNGWMEGTSPFAQPSEYAFLIFLAYLGLVTFASVRHGVVVLRDKKDPATAGTWNHRALAWCAIAASLFVIFFALTVPTGFTIVLLALSPVGLTTGYGVLRYVGTPPASSKGWFYEHMGAMIGAGIAFHTAFAVFGFGRFFGITIEGPFQIVPWILPSAIGIPGSFLWQRYYQRKFGELKPAAAG